jgi:hypothetical protein
VAAFEVSGRPAVGAIYNPSQGQVKNAEIAVFRPFWPRTS